MGNSACCPALPSSPLESARLRHKRVQQLIAEASDCANREERRFKLDKLRSHLRADCNCALFRGVLFLAEEAGRVQQRQRHNNVLPFEFDEYGALPSADELDNEDIECVRGDCCLVLAAERNASNVCALLLLEDRKRRYLDAAMRHAALCAAVRVSGAFTDELVA